jgi:hypothetical protein
MKKTFILLATMLTAALAFAQSTATITGNLIDQSETGTSSGISLDVTLMNTNSQRCFVNGVGSLVKEKQTYTAAQVLAGITLAKNANITCGLTSGGTRWRFSFRNSQLNTSRDCDLQITGATSLNTATCLQATTTPTTTVPTSSLFLLLDGSNSMTGNLIPAVNATQSVGTSGARWDVFADMMDVGTTLNVAGASTLANVTLGTGNNLNVNNIKQQAGAAFVLADPLGPSHIFISSSSPYTNTFVNGNGAGVVFLGSAAKTSVADTTGSIITAGSIALQTTSQTLPATIVNDTAGGIAVRDNATHLWQFDNATGILFDAGNGFGYRGATSGISIVRANAVAGASNVLTLPTSTDTLVGKATTDTLTNKTIDTAGPNTLKLNGATINGIPSVMQFSCTGTATAGTTLSLSGGPCTNTSGIQFPISSAATFANLRCKSQTAGVGAGSGVVTVRKNAVGSTITCTFGTSTVCTDTAHSFSAVAADTIDLVFTTAGGETLANIGCTVEKQ